MLLKKEPRLMCKKIVHKLAIYVHTYEFSAYIWYSQIFAAYMLFSFDRSCVVIFCFPIQFTLVVQFCIVVYWVGLEFC